MADIINHSLRKGKKIHRKLVTELTEMNHIDNTVFVTTNYDILCDNALLDLYPCNPSESFCRKCDTVYSPIIVPPTFYKDLSKVFLNQVWNKAENDLLGVDHLIFCGYSFPDADIHIKYLIKRIQKNRKHPNTLKVSIVNSHEGKTDEMKADEENRFKRFLGKQIKYTPYSFEDFARQPSLIIK
jgi:hypothetical protein